MEQFLFYISLGFKHILDPQGLDHCIFIITLCAAFQLYQWKNVLLLVTAFTLGHCVTLAISSLEIVLVNSDMVELLIPITILITAFFNIRKSQETSSPTKFNYTFLFALFFGLIHGLGFSNYFKAIMMGESSVILPLFYFNLGIEIGQLIIVVLLFTCLYFYSKSKQFLHHNWNLILSGAGGGVAALILIEKLFQI